MITRKEFLKKCISSACATGLCCAAATQNVDAEASSASCDTDALKNAENRTDAAKARFALMVRELEQSLPDQERRQILHGLGGRCAETFRPTLIDRYKGNLNGFLEEGLRLWMAEAHYDKAAGTIRVVDKSPTCTCPLVKEGATPPSFCDCTLGWQEAAYSAILGRPVTAKLEESILRGDKRCVFFMKIEGTSSSEPA